MRICADICALLFVSAAVGIGETYPEVPLQEGSAPVFMTIATEPFTLKPAYLLFDGNVKSGYSRVYVWCPGDAKYGNPVPLAAADKKFPKLEFEKTHEQGKSLVSWTIGYDIREHGSGGSYFDYVTGKTIEREASKVTVAQFTFSVDYKLADSKSLNTAGRNFPLDLTISGVVNGGGSRTNLPPALAPWNQLRIDLAVTASPSDKKGGSLTFVGKLFWGGSPCVVRSLPKTSEFYLKVAPFREEPIFADNVDPVLAFGAGHTVEAPFGWYDFSWKFKCDGIKEPAVNRQEVPYAFAPPPPPGI